MFELKIDMGEIEQVSKRLDVAKDQIPFAMAQSLNASVFAARRQLTEDTWPRSVTQRNKTFPSSSVR